MVAPVDIFWPRNVAQENFFFCFDFEDAAASLSWLPLRALLDASRALDEWCAYAGLVCCARSCALTLGWAGGAKPVPSGMDWLGACPGGGTT